jgi:microcystin-dependent protein
MGDGSDLTALEADGWYLCDGRLISDLSGLTADKKNTLQQLFSRAGNPSPGNLPDLRGYFLRGADRGQGKDLDFDVRLGTGNRIGSLQEDAVQQHRHFGFDAQRAGCGDPYVDAFSNDESKFASSYNDYFTCAQVYCNILATKTGTGTPKEPTVAPTSFQTKSSKSSTETRPKNVYVNYIIKAR